jgi:predicted amidohydrolase
LDIRVAAVQMDARPWATDQNLARAARLVEQAVGHGAQLVVLPEMFSSGYEYTDRNLTGAEPLDGPTGTWLIEIARQHNIHLMGSFPARMGRDQTILAMLAEPSGRRWVYSKNHIALWENIYYTRGSDVCIADTDLGRIGMILCWDTLYADLVRRQQGRVDLLCIGSSPPNLSAGEVYRGEATVCHTDYRYSREGAKEAAAWFFEGTRRQAQALGVPVVHALRTGAMDSPLPYPLLSGLLTPPGFAWRVLRQMGFKYRVRAPFIAHSLIADRTGQVLVSLGTEEGVAVADVQPGAPEQLPLPPRGRTLVPGSWFLMQALFLHDVLALLGSLRYRARRRG